MRWRKVGRPDGLIDGILWLTKEWDGPGLAVEVSGWPDGHRHTMLEFRFGGDDYDLGLALGGHLWSIFLNLQNVFPKGWRKSTYEWARRRAIELEKGGRGRMCAYELDPFQGRSIGVRIFGGSIWVDIWNDDSGWSSDDVKHLPWNGGGWKFNWSFQDFLLGKSRFEKELISDEDDRQVVMPEGTYPARVRIYRARWPRARDPFSWRHQYMHEVKVRDGVPHPGKGTMAHNCGDDATFSLSFTEKEQLPAHVACSRLASRVPSLR